MATKWKNYDTGFRILAIFLVMITAFSGCFCTYLAARNFLLFDMKNTETYYDSPYFQSNFYALVYNLSAYAQYNNSNYLTGIKTKKELYERKYSELMQEQKTMELRLDQMLWLQNHGPYSEFDPNIFINCQSPDDYIDALDAFYSDVKPDKAKFYELLENNSLPEFKDATAQAEPQTDQNQESTSVVNEETEPSPTIPAANKASLGTAATSLQAEPLELADWNKGDNEPATAAETTHGYYEDSGYQKIYYDESDNEIPGSILNPSGYAAELKGYLDPTTWLYYYYSIRTYLVERVGSPVYSDNIYNYTGTHIADYTYYADDNTFVYPDVGSLQYVFICSQTGEYLTNIKAFIPEKASETNMYQADDMQTMLAALTEKIENAQWGLSVTKNGVIGSFGTQPVQTDELHRELYGYRNINDLTAEELGGELYLYSDLDNPNESHSDVFTYCYRAYQDAQDHQNLYVALAVLSFAIFLLVCIYILAVGTVKKTAMDKLYNDWHFILSLFLLIAAGGGCIASFAARWDMNIYYKSFLLQITEYLIPLTAAIFLLILLEYITSVIRSGRNDSLIRHSAWYAFFRLLAEKVAKKRLKTDPTYYKKQYKIVLAVGVLYTVLTTVAVTLLAGACYGDFILPYIFSWALAAVDVLILILILRHLKALNLITELSQKIRQGDYSAQLNISALPQYLQPLASNLLYNSEGIKNAVEKSVQDERMKAELITNVSHDLKTPLTSVVNYVDLLKKCDIQDETAIGYINILEEKSDKLKHLIEDLVEASKASTGNIKLNRMNVNLYEMALQVIGENSDALAQLDIQIEINDPVGEVIVFADNLQTWRIIDNLFSNIKKYTMPGTRVYVDVREQNGKGVFSVKNISKTRLNIPAEELTQRFVRGDDFRGGEGSGLGLSIAKSLCELQNGIFRLDIDGDLFKATVILPKSYNLRRDIPLDSDTEAPMLQNT